eukprot:scaffold12063_cov19-Tisochrysis_lutea.AAC.1
MIQALGKQKALMAASFGWLLGSATDQPSKGSFQKDVSSSERPAHARLKTAHCEACDPCRCSQLRHTPHLGQVPHAAGSITWTPMWSTSITAKARGMQSDLCKLESAGVVVGATRTQ